MGIIFPLLTMSCFAKSRFWRFLLGEISPNCYKYKRGVHMRAEMINVRGPEVHALKFVSVLLLFFFFRYRV